MYVCTSRLTRSLPRRSHHHDPHRQHRQHRQLRPRGHGHGRGLLLPLPLARHHHRHQPVDGDAAAGPTHAAGGAAAGRRLRCRHRASCAPEPRLHLDPAATRRRHRPRLLRRGDRVGIPAYRPAGVLVLRLYHLYSRKEVGPMKEGVSRPAPYKGEPLCRTLLLSCCVSCCCGS